MKNSTYTYNASDLSTAYDLEDIGQFSVSENEWSDFTNEEFGQLGAEVVNQDFGGDLKLAYDVLVK